MADENLAPSPDTSVGESPALEQPIPEPVQAPQPEPEASVPSWRLREEAEGRRMAEERARAVEHRLNQIDQHFRRQAAKQQPPNWFEDPDRAVQAAFMRMAEPFIREHRATRQQLMHMGRHVAASRHGEDKVEAAERAFLQARAQRVLDPMDYERVVGAPNRYDAVVSWHKRNTAQATVGDDPEAWFEKQLDTQLANPKFQAALLERIRTGAVSRPSTTRLPPSLSKSTAAIGNGTGAGGDLSDESLWNFAKPGG